MQYNKKFLFWLVLIVIMLTSFGVFFFLRKPVYVYKQGVSAEVDDAVVAASDLFRVRTAGGIDLSNGPCLSNDLRAGWVVDIVHNPRESIDDLPENQCQAYTEGRAKHFVELDQKGNLIRTK